MQLIKKCSTGRISLQSLRLIVSKTVRLLDLCTPCMFHFLRTTLYTMYIVTLHTNADTEQKQIDKSTITLHKTKPNSKTSEHTQRSQISFPMSI